MVIKCPKCENWTDSDSKFCPTCGASLSRISKQKTDSDFSAASDFGRRNRFNDTTTFDNAENETSYTDYYDNAAKQPYRQTPNRDVKPRSHATLIAAIIGILGIIAALIFLITGFTHKAVNYVDRYVVNANHDPGTIIDWSGSTDDTTPIAIDPAALGGLDLVVEPQTLIDDGFRYLRAVGNITTQTLVDNNNVTMTVTGMTYRYGSLYLQITATNKTDMTLSFTCDTCIIDGYAIDAGYYESLAPYESAAQELAIYSDVFEDTELINIGEITLKFRVYNEDDYSQTAANFYTTLQTTTYGLVQPSDADRGLVFYDDGLLKLSALKLKSAFDNDDDDYVFTCLIQNDSDRDCYVELTDIFINGMRLDYNALYAELPAGTKTVGTMYIWESDLDDIDVDTIESLSFVGSVRDANTFANLAEIPATTLSLY